MKKKCMMPLQRIAELDPKDGFLQQSVSVVKDDDEYDLYNSTKVKEESHSFNSNGNIWDKEW